MKNTEHSSFDEFYKKNPNYYKEPSDGLISCINELGIVPGRALDIGCGQGRNAIWLAKNGFTVNAFDPAERAINNLQIRAEKNNLQIDAYIADLCAYEIPCNSFDLIVAQTTLNHIYPHNLPAIAKKMMKSLKNGGTVYVVCFTEEDPGYTQSGHEKSECSLFVKHYFKKNELIKLFEGLDIFHYSEYRKIDNGHGPSHYHGKAKLIARRIV